MFGPVNPWDRSGDRTGEQLRGAMAQNPYLHVLIQSGYYDGATTYYDAKYTMWHLDPSGKMKDRLEFKGYRSGHMMYLRREDLKNANDDIRTFIQKKSRSRGNPCKILECKSCDSLHLLSFFFSFTGFGKRSKPSSTELYFPGNWGSGKY